MTKITENKIIKELKKEIKRLLVIDSFALSKYYIEIARKIKARKTIDNDFLFTSSTNTEILKSLKDIDFLILDYLQQEKLLNFEE